ncbi:MAG: hypothetical protein K2X81_27755 [Candidatus Obscuribacterales bacterium]|nr:hypothetical protein [Candidatus Obscuribacterales bacterium]
MKTIIEEEQKVNQVKATNLRLARRANNDSVVLALPQPGGADILRAKKELQKK